MKRVVVITGVRGGIGRACADAFVSGGWSVAGTDRLPPPADLPLDHFVKIDLAAPRAGDAFAAFLSELPRVDALISNAGLLVAKTLVDTTDAEWDAVMATNVRAAFVAVRAAYPHLRSSRGSIVMVSSVHAVATSPGVAAYATSKGALLAMTRAAAVELAADGVRVNAILPGAVDTPMLEAGLARTGKPMNDSLRELGSRIPVGRIARPEEIAGVILFLADSDRSSFLTGQAWVVDGGVTARLSSE